MSFLTRLKKVYRVRKPADEPEPHEHEWLSIGTYHRDLSFTPTVVVVCDCGAWTTVDLDNDQRVESEQADGWRFTPPEKTAGVFPR